MSLAKGWATTSMFVLAGVAFAQTQATRIQINEGESAAVTSPTLAASAAATPTIEVVKVVDLTSQGCEGGPRACPDRADVVLSVGGQKQNLTLYIAHTAAQRQQEANKKAALGFDLVLTEVHGKAATFMVQKAAPPANPQGKQGKK